MTFCNTVESVLLYLIKLLKKNKVMNIWIWIVLGVVAVVLIYLGFIVASAINIALKLTNDEREFIKTRRRIIKESEN